MRHSGFLRVLCKLLSTYSPVELGWVPHPQGGNQEPSGTCQPPVKKGPLAPPSFRGECLPWPSAFRLPRKSGANRKTPTNTHNPGPGLGSLATFHPDPGLLCERLQFLFLWDQLNSGCSFLSRSSCDVLWTDWNYLLTKPLQSV